MSNHLHIVLRDDEGELASWASYVLGNLARAVNRIRDRTGTCFERRYSAEPILDVEALHDRLVYVVANPVKAALCERASDWPGVVLFAPDEHSKELRVSWFDRAACRQGRSGAQGNADLQSNSVDFRIEAPLVVDPIPATDESGYAAVAAAIEARERALALEHKLARRRVLTRAMVLAQSWRTAPGRPKRSPRPICHAADPVLREKFKKGIDAFIGAFREAAQRVREGALSGPFPDWSFPPGSLLVRPAVARSDLLPA